MNRYKKYFNPLNIIFVTSVALFVPLALGVVPRSTAFVVAALYLSYTLFAPVASGLNLFLRSIPIFIALPITGEFDNLNLWRILIAVLFVRWAWEQRIWRVISTRRWKETRLKTLFTRWGIEIFGISFFLFAGVSLLVAPDVGAGIRRIIFLANAAALFVMLASLVRSKRAHLYHFAKNFSYSGLLAVAFGYFQFLVAYLMPAWVFHYWWGQVVSLNMYGTAWADIVTDFGNTWFSYSGATLRLRMFSTFPDSHSFPMYVIMTIPAMFYVAFTKWKALGTWLFERGARVLQYPRTKTTLWLLALFAFANLALILSGTRGIWVSGLLALLTLAVFRWSNVHKRFARVLLIWFLIFALMFPIYFAIVSFPQFQDSDFTAAASINRLRSIIDFGEVSNRGRIGIWRTTISFIAKNPILGIGIGNYPLVLSEPQSASQAGASAHNMYLHIISTIGLFGLAAFFAFIFEIVRRGVRYARTNATKPEALYAAATLFALAWIGAYLMTDAALYDGRALLAFLAMTGMATGLFGIPGKSRMTR